MADNVQLINQEKLVRLAEVIDWLIFHNVVSSRRELAKRMEYQESMLSLVVNGKKPVSEKFLSALAGVDSRLNINWIDSGKGDMILEEREDKITPSREELEILRQQQETVKKAQEQLTEAFKLGNEKIILTQQSIVQKESDTLDTLVTAFTLKKERMMAIIGNNNKGNYLDSPNSGNQNIVKAKPRAKRYVRKKSENQ